MKIVVTPEELAALVADMINAELSPDQPVLAENVKFTGYHDKVVAEVDMQGMTFRGFSDEFCDED